MPRGFWVMTLISYEIIIYSFHSRGKYILTSEYKNLTVPSHMMTCSIMVGGA